ncbi:hypothetical protein ACHAXA_007781 [Cyclostephanos tholiformis]|uniref:tRNA-specific adenosine deaminase 1 n=1 Tax=Cyclostephanos tholiformis TaxID=382380 RepID=A0ABD3R8U2_9STRA
MHRRIAQCAIDHYHDTLPSNNGGKPQTGREWTVYAAIVAYRQRRDDDDDEWIDAAKSDECDDRPDRLMDQGDMWVVSCATGSKCTSIRSIVSSLPRSGENHDNGTPRVLHHNRATRDRGNNVSHFSDLDEGSICKCYKGMVLKDSHAETLARRGLMSCLWDEIEYYLQLDRTKSTDDVALVKEKNEGHRARQLLDALNCPQNKDDQGRTLSFRLRRDISLHMYVSDSPCGDASIYEIRRRCDQQPQNNNESNEIGDTRDTELNFTGAKIILSAGDEGQYIDRSNGSISSILTCSFVDQESTRDDTKQSAITLGREETQQLGALRIKSSRSNMPPELRSTSMSCSDKILRWGVFGLQGSLLAMYISKPILLSSICVSKDLRSVDGGSDDGQLAALKRALSGRIENVFKTTAKPCGNEDWRSPDVAVVDIVFESSKTAADHRYLEWQTNIKKSSVELTSSVPCKRPRMHGHAQNSVVKNGSRHFTPQSTSNSKKESACGMSINWHQNYLVNGNADRRRSNEATEITIGATGLKRGKRPKTPKDVLGSASRLCRFNFLLRCMRCKELQQLIPRSLIADADVATKKNSLSDPSSPSTEGESYTQYKRRSGRYNGEECFDGPLMGYIRSGNGDDFILPQV